MISGRSTDGSSRGLAWIAYLISGLSCLTISPHYSEFRPIDENNHASSFALGCSPNGYLLKSLEYHGDFFGRSAN